MRHLHGRRRKKSALAQALERAELDQAYAADCLIAFRRGGSDDDELAEEVGALLLNDAVFSLRCLRKFIEALAKQGGR